MKWLMAIGWALGGAAVGTVVAGLGAAAYVQLTNMTSREGAAGYFIVGMGLLGGVLGLVGGLLWFARGGMPGQFGLRLGQGTLALVAVAALLAAAVWGWMQTREVPVMIGNAQVQLLMEFRVPVAAAPTTPWAQVLNVEVNTSSTRMEALLQPDALRQEDGHVVIPALLGPLVRSGNRLVVARVRWPAGPRDELFTPTMPRTPDPAADWSPWASPSQIYTEQGEPLRAPPLLSMRWRVRVYGQ